MPKYISPNSITLFNGTQLIFRFVGDPHTTASGFDFLHTKMWYLPEKDLCFKMPGALNAAKEKKLIFQSGKFPLTSFYRMQKFLSRNYSIDKKSSHEIIKALANLDLAKPRSSFY